MKPDTTGRITPSRLLVGFALLSLALIVATTAGSPDVVSHDETDVLELEPAGDGTYTQIDDETGEIQIILTEENPNLNADGVNNDALTDIGPVFTVENVLEQQSNATVWISHDSDAVEFYVPGEGTAESQADGVFMQPGDSETIAMRVDTRETDEITLDSINVMAVLDPEVESGGSGGGGDYQSSSVGDSGDDDDSGTETPDSRETDTETESTPELTGTATPTPGQSQSTPTPTVAATPTPTDDPIGEEAGLDPSSLLWLLVALAALLLLFALARRRRSEE